VRCKTCHYSLAGLTGPPHRCPECGREFDPDDPTTFETPESKREAQNNAGLWVLAGFGSLFAIGLAVEKYFAIDPVVVALSATGIGLVVLIAFWLRSERELS
jgi:hypothetical protein